MKRFAVRFVVLCASLLVGVNVALAQFDGQPATPLPIGQHAEAVNFDIQVHSRDSYTWQDLEPIQAQHGADCAGPPASHENHTYEGSVYVCRDHVMTALNATGYGVIYLTPARILDLTTGSGIVQWDMSTERMSARDWPDVWVTPWNNNIPLPFDEGDVDLQGPPQFGVHVNLNNGPPLVSTISNYGETMYNQPWEVPTISEGVIAGTNQAAARQTFRLTLSAGHLRLERLASASASALVFFDGNVDPFPMAKSVVQFGHHSYNPTKDGSGVPATWHWDNLTLTPSDAFTLIKANKRFVDDSAGNDTIQFAQPAPSNAFLRFSGAARIEYSLDNGATWAVAPKATPTTHVEHMSNYFFPVPAGTQNVKFRFSPDDWYGCGFGCIAKDFALWSQGGTTTPPPAPTSTNTPAPIATATRTATAGPGTATSVPATSTSTSVPTSTRTPAPTQTPVYSGTTTPSVTGQWQSIMPAGVSTDFNNPPLNYGFQIIATDPSHPGTVYVGTNYQGIYKSTNSGSSWARVDVPWSTSCGSFDGRVFALAVDPRNSDVWATNGYGCAQGAFKSTDGGVHWTQMLPTNGPIIDVNRIAIDPNMAGHVLVSAHSNHSCPDVCDTPVGESFDGGATWRFTAPIPGSGWGQWVFFLNNSSSWLVAAQDHGMFRTTNSGASWTKVSTNAPLHGNEEMYRLANGALFLGTNGGIIRSTDEGATWTTVWSTGVSDGVYTIGGDGVSMFARSSNTGMPTTGPLPMMTSTDGGNTWQVQSGTMFANGPMSMSYDPVNKYLFSSNWLAGVFRLPTGSSSTTPATSTPVPATSTPSPVPPTATKTATPVNSPTAVPTNTTVPGTTPTNTPAGSTSTPTNTPVGPTATKTNTPAGATATKTKTPSSATSTPTTTSGTAVQAEIMSPTAGSTLPGSTAMFTRNDGTGVADWKISVGKSLGGSDILTVRNWKTKTYKVSSLPTDGSKVYVRIWSFINSNWQTKDYSYTSAGSTAKAAILSPAPGSTLPGSTATFTRSIGSGVTGVKLSIGSQVGWSDYFYQTNWTSTSTTVSTLPVNGSTVYVRLWSYLNNVWVWNDYAYTASSGASSLANQTAAGTPTPAAKSASSSAAPPPNVELCSAPTILTSSDSNPSGAGTVAFSWSPMQNAVSYTIQREFILGGWKTVAITRAVNYQGEDSPKDPRWRVFVSEGSCGPIPGPVVIFDP